MRILHQKRTRPSVSTYDVYSLLSLPKHTNQS
jgi:hypothetical protein